MPWWKRWSKRRSKAQVVGYEQAREIVRQATEPGWKHGTYFLDDRFILQTDQCYWFSVGAREYVVDGDNRYALPGPEPIVGKYDGKLRWVPTHEIGWEPTLRRTPNPEPTCDGPLPPSVGRTPTYEQARELVRRETEPGWSIGTYCLDDRSILENDEYYVFVVGAREFLIDGDHSYAIEGGNPIVYKAYGRMDWIASPRVAMDETLRSKPNPNPTMDIARDGASVGTGTTTFTDEPAANHDDPHPTTLTYAILFKDPVTDEDVVAIADAILHQRG